MKVIQIALAGETEQTYPSVMILTDTGRVYLSTLVPNVLVDGQAEWVQVRLPDEVDQGQRKD